MKILLPLFPASQAGVPSRIFARKGSLLSHRRTRYALPAIKREPWSGWKGERNAEVDYFASQRYACRQDASSQGFVFSTIVCLHSLQPKGQATSRKKSHARLNAASSDTRGSKPSTEEKVDVVLFSSTR